MFKKLVKFTTGAGVAVAGAALTLVTHAQSVFTVPTSTASTLTANIGDQLADPGLLLVIGLAAGIPLAFYVIHQILGMLPKGRGGRRS
jgi:hypothetical protein